MAIDQTGNAGGPSGNYEYDHRDGSETVPSRRGGTGDGVDNDPTIGDIWRGRLTRDHRKPSFLQTVMDKFFGPKINWAKEIKEEGGVERLLDAANDPTHPHHESAKEFMESKSGALAVQEQIQKNAQFHMMITNTMQALHQIQKSILQNIRV